MKYPASDFEVGLRYALAERQGEREVTGYSLATILIPELSGGRVLSKKLKGKKIRLAKAFNQNRRVPSWL